MFLSPYQVGGSLKSNDSSYVIRGADSELYHALKRGNFCSVLEARQMGKSSLLVRVKRNLEAEGFCCVSLDMSNLTDRNTTQECWYKRLLFQIACELDLIEKIQFHAWWEKHQTLQPVRRLNHFIQEILTLYYPQSQLIFLIDEVDSLLSLPFSVDDFFNLIRFYSDRTAIPTEYHRLTFAVFGVTTPSSLVKNSLKSPFLIGTEIKLSGFKATEVQPLIQGLQGKVSQPHLMLKQILFWTNGQPFLTQKLCQIIWNIIQQSQNQQLIIPPKQEKYLIAQLAHFFVIKNWEYQDEPEHLRTVQNRIINCQNSGKKLLKIYYKILKGSDIKVNQSREQRELLLSGLVVRKRGLLKVKNPIYHRVFNPRWVEHQLTHIPNLEYQNLEYQSVFKRSSFSSS